MSNNDNEFLLQQVNKAIQEAEKMETNNYLSTALSNIKTEITHDSILSDINDTKDLIIGMVTGAILGAFIYASDVQAKEYRLTLGIGTPVTQTQDIYVHNKRKWKMGDVIGSAIIATDCPIFKELDCSIWHHSLLNDNNDAGVTGGSISYTIKFDL